MKPKTQLLKTAIVISILFFSGCMKMGSGNYYVKFKADGKKLTYKALTLSNYNLKYNDSSYTSYFSGNKSILHTTKDFLNLGFTQNIEITSGVTYSNDVTVGTLSADFHLMILYFDKDGNNYESTNPNGGFLETHCTINEVTETSLKGVFSGKVYCHDTQEYVDITDGEFCCQRTD